jgi:hypothetical protein
MQSGPLYIVTCVAVLICVNLEQVSAAQMVLTTCYKLRASSKLLKTAQTELLYGSLNFVPNNLNLSDPNMSTNIWIAKTQTLLARRKDSNSCLNHLGRFQMGKTRNVLEVN